LRENPVLPVGTPTLFTGFSRACTPKIITICCPSGRPNSKLTTIKGFWVQYLQKSKLRKKSTRESWAPIGYQPFFTANVSIYLTFTASVSVNLTFTASVSVYLTFTANVSTSAVFLQFTDNFSLYLVGCSVNLVVRKFSFLYLFYLYVRKEEKELKKKNCTDSAKFTKAKELGYNIFLNLASIIFILLCLIRKHFHRSLL
jgi:hypothetical protein